MLTCQPKPGGLASCEKPTKIFSQINLYHRKIMMAVLYHKICFDYWGRRTCLGNLGIGTNKWTNQLSVLFQDIVIPGSAFILGIKPIPYSYLNSVKGTWKRRGGPEGTCKYLSTTFLVCRLTTSYQDNHRNQLLKEQEKHHTSGCDQSTARHMGEP